MVLGTLGWRQHLVMSLALLSVLLLPSSLHSQDATTSLPVTAEMHYPEAVTAGDAFQVEASVTNTGSRPLLISVNLVCPFAEITGTHRPSFRMLDNPLRPASYRTPVLLSPDQAKRLSLRSFHYEAGTFFGGDLVFPECTLRIRDSHQETLEQPVAPMHIRITHEGAALPVPLPEPSDRLPLEQRFSRTPDADIPWLLHDPNTRLEWLPLTVTRGQSLVQVMEQTREGGRFDGFVVASLPEVKALVMNAIQASGETLPEYVLAGHVQDMDGRPVSGPPLAPAASTINHLFGVTDSRSLRSGDSDSSAGFVLGTADEPRAVLEAGVSHVTHPSSGRFFATPASRLWPSSRKGVWLYRHRRQGDGS